MPFWWEDIAIEAESLFEKAASSSKKPEVVLGFDGSLTEDSTGIVAIDLETNAMHLLYRWEKDRSVTDWHVDLEEVDMAFRKCFELFEVKKAYLDPSRHWDLVKRWQKDFTKAVVRDIPPTITRMGPLSTQFRNDVVAKYIFHTGDKDFSAHVLNAVETIKGTPAKETRNSHKKIDFLVCAILANGARCEVMDTQRRSSSAKDFFA